MQEVYSGLTAAVVSLSEVESFAPSRCVGWARRDLVVHVLADAQRALVALNTPAGRAASINRVGYWAATSDADFSAAAVSSVRLMGSAWSWSRLSEVWSETAAAAAHLLGQTSPGAVLLTQGHCITAQDLASTLVVEAAIHHLDLVVGLNVPGPPPGPLREVRQVLEALHGNALPGTDEQIALYGTGRDERQGLRLRLLG